MIMNYKGFVPDVNNAAFVADNACVIGRVQMMFSAFLDLLMRLR